MKRALVVGVLLLLDACGSEDEEAAREDGGLAGRRYDVEGLPSCSRLSALAAWQGSCGEGEACAWSPELDDGVCAPGCDTQGDCPDGSACRHTDDGDGWVRRWCAPVVREEI